MIIYESLCAVTNSKPLQLKQNFEISAINLTYIICFRFFMSGKIVSNCNKSNHQLSFFLAILLYFIL